MRGHHPTSFPRRISSSPPSSSISWRKRRSPPWCGPPPLSIWWPTPACWRKRFPPTCVLSFWVERPFRPSSSTAGGAALPAVQYTNLYGPTEVTVDCTWYPIQREFADDERIPIGRPAPTKRSFSWMSTSSPCPQDSRGSSASGASGLAKGYFGQWDKTRSAFIQDPRNPNYPDLVYRTGDLAVMDEAGLHSPS